MMSNAGDAGGGGAGGDVHVVDLSGAAAAAAAAADRSASDEITPLLMESGRKPVPMNIFSVSYPRKRSPLMESTPRAADTDVPVLYQIILWAWSGSRYSGLLCMASSVTIYYIMEVLMDIFPVQSMPLFETVFTRSTIISILSVVWLRRSRQPLFAPAHTRSLLVIRSLTGSISLLSFVYSIQHLPLAYAVVLNFATPLLASIGAKVILRENWALPDIGGLAFSFLGLLSIFRPILTMTGSYPIFPILVGIFSSAMGGITYCLIQAGAKSSDQPVYTVLSFGVLANPVSAICTFAFQEFVLPNLFTFLMMIVLGVLAFFAEISLARGLQLEKISKVTNILYIKVLLSQVGNMAFSRTGWSIGELMGSLLIFVSACSTLYLLPEKEIE